MANYLPLFFPSNLKWRGLGKKKNKPGYLFKIFFYRKLFITFLIILLIILIVIYYTRIRNMWVEKKQKQQIK